MRREMARVPYDPGWRGAATQADGRAAVLTERDRAKGSQCKTQRPSAKGKQNALREVHSLRALHCLLRLPPHSGCNEAGH
jgi:hypothetical protein